MHPCEPWKPQGENTKISQNLPYNKRRRSYHTINRGSHVLAKNQSGSEVHLERNCDRSVAEEVLLGEPLLSDWVHRHRFLCRCPPDLGVAFASRMAGRKRTMTDGFHLLSAQEREYVGLRADAGACDFYVFAFATCWRL
jgi:hypothetical protein